MQLGALHLKAQRLELRSRYLVMSHYSGLYRSAFRGQGMEFAEVREYADGDDVRSIDWNVSARSNALFVKKMVEERERNVLVILDTSGSLGFGSIRRTKFEVLLELGALFILSAFYARDRASVALVGETVEPYIPPAKGWNHAARLIREMVHRDPFGPSCELEKVWRFLISPGVPRGLVIVLTDFHAPLRASNACTIASRKHEVLAFIVSDPREWSLPAVGRLRIRDPETGQECSIDTNRKQWRSDFESSAREKRAAFLRVLDGAGISWLEFSTNADYDAPLRRFLANRSIRRGYRRP